jgi:hypothetical protein
MPPGGIRNGACVGLGNWSKTDNVPANAGEAIGMTALVHVFPCLALHDGGDGLYVYAEREREAGVRRLSGGMATANFSHIGFGQSRRGVLLSMPHPVTSLGITISHVLSNGASEDVRWVTAARVIARMAAVRLGPLAVRNQIRNSMRFLVLAAKPEVSVPVTIPEPEIRPAGIRTAALIDFRPEARSVCLGRTLTGHGFRLLLRRMNCRAGSVTALPGISICPFNFSRELRRAQTSEALACVLSAV